MTFENVALTDYFDIVSPGVKPFEGKKKYVATGSLETGTILSFEDVDYQNRPSRANMQLIDGDIMFAKMKDTEKVFVVSKENAKNIYSTGFSVLRIKDKKEFVPEFVYYWLRSPYFQKLKNKECTGATQKALNETKLSKFKVPKPSPEIQKKIVAILEKAEKMLELREEADGLANKLSKSVFYELFGDPVKNTKKWRMLPIDEITDSRLGKMLDSKKQTGRNKRKYLRNTNVQWNRFDLSDVLEMDFNDADRKEFRLKKGDLLVCEGGDVGRCAIWNEELPECYFQKALHRIRCHDDKIVPEYLLYVLWRYSEYNGFQNITHSSTITHLTGEMIKKIVIPVPPLVIQQNFVKVLESINKIKQSQNDSKDLIDELQKGLIQSVFKGEFIC